MMDQAAEFEHQNKVFLLHVASSPDPDLSQAR
jgi:hypothetical protein